MRLAIKLNSTGHNLTVSGLFAFNPVSSTPEAPAALQVPHNQKDSFTVDSRLWFSWPLNIPLLPSDQRAFADAESAATAAAVPRILSATAQLTTHATLLDGTVVLFFVETEGIKAEVALALGDHATINSTPGATASTEQGATVLRSINAGTSSFASLTVAKTKVQLVLLPADYADRVFKIAESGRVLVAGNGGAAGGVQTQLLMVRRTRMPPQWILPHDVCTY